jgi:hypothetical protein
MIEFQVRAVPEKTLSLGDQYLDCYKGAVMHMEERYITFFIRRIQGVLSYYVCASLSDTHLCFSYDTQYHSNPNHPTVKVTPHIKL